jgi:hypothetical protein
MLRTSFLLALVAGPLALAACGGSSGTSGDDPSLGNNGRTTGAGGAPGQGGATSQGGGFTTTTTHAGGTSSHGGAGPSGGAGQGGAGGSVPSCSQGTVQCDGNVKKVCDGQGGYSDVIDCSLQGGLVCIDGFGCATCKPGTGSCVGDVGTTCKADGSGYETETCDALQGTACDGATGHCTGACSAKSLGKSYIGCDYYPTVTANLVAELFDFAVAVSNTTASPATVTITKGAQQVSQVTVAPNSVEVVTLPWVPQLKGPANNGGQAFPSSILVKQGSYRLRSTQPVTVYQFNPLQYSKNGVSSYSNDASLLLPHNAWTGTYFVASYPTFMSMSGLYAVTAAEDGTTVTVKAGPSSAIKGGVGGLDGAGNGQVALAAGDVMEIVTSNGDLTGTEIVADKPVQVIGGHQCTFIPQNVGYCDHIEESMFPFETLSTSYLVTAPVIPTQPQPKVEIVRIIATTDNTNLTFDPPKPGAPASIAKAGSFAEIVNDAGSFQVTGDQPILVVQYMEGQDAGGGSGDPAMALAVAKDQFRGDYLVHAPTNYEKSYANIVAPTGVDVLVDGAPVQGFSPIGNSGFSGATVALSNGGDGNHTATSAKAFGIQVYGYGQYTSYWYAGGSNLTKLHN